MKKLLLGLTLAGMAANSAQAVILSDIDRIDVTLNAGDTFDGAAGTANNDFNIATDDVDGFADVAGYVPGSGLDGAIFGFNFTTFEGTFNVQYTVGAFNGFGIGGVAGTTFALGGVLLGLQLTDLENDGILEYTVTNNGGPSFILNTASLVAWNNVVPDGGSTVMLLGSTLVGMAALARRRK